MRRQHGFDLAQLDADAAHAPAAHILQRRIGDALIDCRDAARAPKSDR